MDNNSNGNGRAKKLLYNSITSLMSQIASVVCSFIISRLILTHFGSNTNGLVSSITQFLGFIAFLEMGIGSVVKSALYEPLAKNDYDEVSKIVQSCKNFFRNIARILIVYTAVLTVVFPIISRDQFDYLYIGSLVIIISISLFAQYYFGMPYQLLINADQKTYIFSLVTYVTLILNTVVSAVLMELGGSIQLVKLSTSLIYIIRPIFYNIYVKHHYPRIKKVKLTEEPLKQKWNGVAQNIAFVVTNYTDIIVLTLLSTLTNVSIYTIYHNVTMGIQQVISSVSIGITAMFGNILYSEKHEELKRSFSIIEWSSHSLVTVLYTVTGILIVPFASIYTRGVNDANYIVPVFSFLIVLAQASYSLRTPYEAMILAANHYKQTQASAIIEASINVIASIILVIRFGLVGVAIGTLAAMTYRTIYFIYYLHRNILHYNISNFIKLLLIDIIQAVVDFFICCIILHFNLPIISWGIWIIRAVITLAVSCSSCLIVNILFNKEITIASIKRLVKTMRRR